MKKYIAKRELANDDWKTQYAHGYSNIPKGAEVQMITKVYKCFYGRFSVVKYNGHTYYVNCDDIEEIEVEENE